MIDTLDTLPGEGDTRTMVQRRVPCDVCGKPAHVKHTFLMLGARTNRRSAAFGRDDCAGCADRWQFTCRECRPVPVPGMTPCERIPAVEEYAEQFLRWEVVDGKAETDT